MKKIITVFLALVLFSFNNYANGDNKKEDENILLSKYSLSNGKSFNSYDTEYDLALMNLQVDVMGFLMFGPQVSFDLQFANMIAVGPYIRWNYAGLIYQGVITDWFYESTLVSPASYGIGVQAKALIPTGSGIHRPYVGLSYERFKGEESYDSGGIDGKHIWEYKSNIILVNMGYRMITSSSFNLSVGLSLGVSTETENIDYYEFDESNIDHNILYSRFIAMLQIGLGWQLGR